MKNAVKILLCSAVFMVVSITNYTVAKAFTVPAEEEVYKISQYHSISEKEAFNYLWGLENQVREAVGLEPIPLPDSQIKSPSLYKMGNNPNSVENKSGLLEELDTGYIAFGADPGVSGPPTSVVTPTISQENLYYCGPAATQMALATKGCYTTPWGSTITQSLLANDYYLETDSYGYTIGSYIKYTLNTILETDFYIYKTVDTDDSQELVRRIRFDHNNGYAPVLAVWQTPLSAIRLDGYPYGNYDLRHYITVDYTSEPDSTLAYIGYGDPLYGWTNVYSNVGSFNVPYNSEIRATDLSWLNSGGSIIY